MKRIILIMLLITAFGCSYGVESYIDDPKTIFKDPMSVEHQEAVDALERRYLKKEISYAQYLEQQRLLEEKYAKDVKRLQSRIEDHR